MEAIAATMQGIWPALGQQTLATHWHQTTRRTEYHWTGAGPWYIHNDPYFIGPTGPNAGAIELRSIATEGIRKLGVEEDDTLQQAVIQYRANVRTGRPELDRLARTVIDQLTYDNYEEMRRQLYERR